MTMLMTPQVTSTTGISFHSATQLGEINGLHDTQYTLSGAYAYQTYKFQIEAGQLDLVLNSISAYSPTMSLYVRTNRTKVGTNDNVDLVTQAVKITSREQRIRIDGLGKGTYYIVVGRSRPAHVPISYQLTIQSRPGQNLIESEPNNTSSRAYRIGGKANVPLVGQRVMHGSISVGRDDIADFYQFTLTQPSYVQAYLSLARSGSRVVLEILDANQRSLRTLSLAPPGMQNYVACDRLPAGTYYAHIRPVGPTNTPYTLTLEGVPVQKGKLTVRMHRITALDDFETWRRGGAGEADFYYRLSIDGLISISRVFEGDNDREFKGTGIWAERKSEKVDIEKRFIPFSISLFEKDPRNDDHADINPISGLRDLNLTYDTLTGEVSGQGLSVQKEGQKITVQGNASPKARLTFEVNYETISSGEIDP